MMTFSASMNKQTHCCGGSTAACFCARNAEILGTIIELVVSILIALLCLLGRWR